MFDLLYCIAFVLMWIALGMNIWSFIKNLKTRKMLEEEICKLIKYYAYLESEDKKDEVTENQMDVH